MKSQLLALTFALAACEQTTATPEGRLLSFDRRAVLPAGVDVSSLTSYSSTLSVCGAPPFAPARLEARWRVAHHGQDVHVVDGWLELIERSPQLVVEARVSPDRAGESLTPGAPWLDVVNVDFKCTRDAFRFPQRIKHRLVDLATLHASGRDATPLKE